MLIGTIEKIGDDLVGKTNLKVGDKIATLVSLSLTPLRIDEIIDVKPEIDRVEIKGKAILFESGIYAVLPEDMPETLALAALDVAGAPAQVAKLVRPCQSVAILGSAGKSGMLCAYEAVKRVGPTGKVIGLVRNEKEAALLRRVSDKVRIVIADATKPIEVLVRPCQSVAILGSAGKSGMLCAYEAVKRVGPTGKVIGLVRNEKEAALLRRVSDKVRVVIADATKPIEVLNAILEANDGQEVDVAINCVNVANTEMSTILPVKDLGIVYFFSMATGFTKAALGAEGVGKEDKK